MTTRAIESLSRLGERIAEARDEARWTQAQLADAVGLDRTAIAKIESGTRKVSATELVTIAQVLSTPIDWFVLEPPATVASRRLDPLVGGFSRELDRVLEQVSRDVAMLIETHLLAPVTRMVNEIPRDFSRAEDLAIEARAYGHLTEGPVIDLQSVCERFGMLAFSFDLGERAGDAAYVDLDTFGVAALNGSVDPGRRRFTLAHELGHHIVGDAFEPAPVLGPGDGNERMISAFAAYFLMPRAAVQRVWDEFAESPTRLAATAVAARFHVSWTAACNQLKNLNLIDSFVRDQLLHVDLRKGDFLELGERWTSELDPPSVPTGYSKAVLSAYRSRRLTPDKTLELLHGTIDIGELPVVDEMTLDELRTEFDV